MSSPDDRDPFVDDWFEDEEQTQVRQQPLRRRPTLPPPEERRIPGIALVGGAVALLLVVLAVVVLTGGDETPAVDPGTPRTDVPEEDEEPATTPEVPTPPAGETPQPLPTEGIMRPGEEGEQVLALQQALTTLGYEPGEPDGNYGPATAEAVRAFQTAAGLPADGIAGPTTLAAINDALAAQG